MSTYKQVCDSMTPGLYIGISREKGILVNDDKTFFVGTVKIKKDKYYYFQYRDGKKVIQKYLGKKRPAYHLRDGNYFD